MDKGETSTQQEKQEYKKPILSIIALENHQNKKTTQQIIILEILILRCDNQSRKNK